MDVDAPFFTLVYIYCVPWCGGVRGNAAVAVLDAGSIYTMFRLLGPPHAVNVATFLDVRGFVSLTTIHVDVCTYIPINNW